MLYLIYGKDSFQGREKLKELTGFFQAKIGNLGIFRIEDENFDSLQFEELIRSQMLFGKKHLVVCNRVLENIRGRIFVKKNIERISATPNIFLFFEEEIERNLLDLFKEHGEKVQEFKLKRVIENQKDYKPFAICDAVAEKNKSRAWVLFQKALLSGIPAEEVFYKIVWQIKNLLLIKKLVAAGVKNLEKETGLHPFVIKKNLYAIKNFTEKELINYSFELLKIYHNIRRGLEEFPLGLEKFLIKL